MSQTNQTLTILVADDNRDNLLALSALMSLMGHDVIKCFDGKTATELFFEHYPQVVMLDLGMPLITGYEVCRAIRNTPEGTKTTIVAQTAWARELDRFRSRQAGFDYHLVKPIDRNQLSDALRKASDRQTKN